MSKNLNRLFVGFIFCSVFFIPLVISFPANAQNVEWVKLLGTNEIDYGRSVTVDTSGNVYVTGDTYGDLGGENNAGYNDIFLAKYKCKDQCQSDSFPWELFLPAFIKKNQDQDIR